MKSRIVGCVTLVTLTLCWGASVLARPADLQLPLTLKTQLRAGSTYNFTFSLYNAQSGGRKLWTEGPVSMKVASNMTIKHTLGSVKPFSQGTAGPVDFSQQLWVQAVGGGKTVRVKLTAVPYALNSGSVPASSITSVEILDGSIVSEDIMPGAVLAGNLADGAALAEILDDDGSGSTLDADTLDGLDSTGFAADAHVHDDFWKLGGNAGTPAGSNFLGTTDFLPFELRVNGLRALRLEPYNPTGPLGSECAPNFIAGHPTNMVLTGASAVTIGGGGSASSPNRIYDCRNTVAGGYGNTAGLDDGHTDWSDAATVGGGYGNVAAGAYSVVAGGDSGLALGDNSAVGGGWGNHAEGFVATVPGGKSNRAVGEASFAAGAFALAARDNTFVWADDSAVYREECESEFYESFFPRKNVACGDPMAVPPVAHTPNPLLAENQFWVRATGGVFFVTGENAGVPQGLWLNPASQAWESIPAPSSDRTLKEALAPVDGDGILRKVAALPVQTWSYKADRDGVRHIGPMAQDFQSAFGVGEDDRRINPIDADGVSLGAIQGLYRKVVALEERVKEQSLLLEAGRAEAAALRTDLAELRRRHASLRRLLDGQTGELRADRASR